MHLFDLAKQFRGRCYARNHLRTAVFLSVFAAVSLHLVVEKGPTHTDQERMASISAKSLPEINESTTSSIPKSKDFTSTTLDPTESGDRKSKINTSVPTDSSNWQLIVVKSGDSLSSVFKRVGLSDQDMFRVLYSSKEASVLNRLFPGYQLEFKIPTTGELEQLRVLRSPVEGYVFTRKNQGYDVETILKTAEIEETFRIGTVSDSLFMAGQKENIPAEHIIQMANIFSGVIDFILDPRQGDQFSILYEEKFLDGAYLGHGHILAAQYVNKGEVFTAIRYVNEAGEAGYFTPEGESLRKAFLRSPLDFFQISSNFNLRRYHPILSTIRAHKGTDYAAPAGTPVRATGDGIVTWAARNGSFGNLIVVKHEGGFETKYAHLSRFAVKKGEEIQQGEVIAYVGTTGAATGPHLHYEFLMHGVHQNPRTILDKLPKAISVAEGEKDRFREKTARLLLHFRSLNSGRLFTLNQPSAE